MKSKKESHWHDDILFKQVQSDYKYIEKEYGSPCDFCGTLCNCDLLFEILDGEKTRKEAYIHMIEYFWQNGIEDSGSSVSTNIRPNERDERIQKIKKRYLID